MLKTPPLQTATATIDTLCGRLSSATLLEDRRAAILGLRSFAKQYPASVASGSLRELITTLKRDGLGQVSSSPRSKDERRESEQGGDVDTIRLVLETLLMLFNPDANSPEASEEIALFMADEFSMRQDNISLLLNLLDPTSPYADYYSRLYSVQLLSAVCAARPERLQECVLSAPLGTSRLVGVLDDGRDAVRNAGLLLLVDLTGGANEDLRKIVAFEDVFGKVFALIRLEGGLADAGIAGQDCLSLMANLIRGSASNQTMFRESGCVSQLAQLLREVFPPATPEARFIAESREKAGWGLLQLLRLFLTRGEKSTIQNQTAFFRAGIAQTLLDIAFHPGLPLPVRVTALKTTADLIALNPPIQEQFAALQIELPSDEPPVQVPAQTNGSRSNATSARNSARPSAEKPRTYIIEALLDLTLDQPRTESPLRAASCTLIQAYLARHDRIKAHFLQRAIVGHQQGEKAANVLTALLQPDSDASSVVFASWIVQDLVADVSDAKKALASVKEGNESEGEDVLTAIQAMGTQLENALQTSADARIVASYLSSLTILLWEFADGVDDLLAEASGLVQALVASVSSAATDALTAGLAASLLGAVYEFSTKDSPIPRRTLAPLLTQKLGRGKYLDALLNLRRDPAVRDFGVEEIDGEGDALNETFVDLFLTEYPRLRKAIDKDPGLEVLPSSAAEAGVDRDVLDDLRQQLQSVKDALSQAQEDLLTNGQQAEQEKLTLQKESQTAAAEVERLRRINQAMQQGHEEESQKTQSQHERQREALNVEHARAMANARQEADIQARQGRAEQERGFSGRIQEYERRLAELGNAHRSEQSGHNSARQQLESLTQRHQELTTREQEASRQLQESKRVYGELQQTHQQLSTRSTQADSDLASARTQLETRESELSALQTQLSDLQAELKGKEDELATERSGFADLEEELQAVKAKSASDGEAAAKLEKMEGLSKGLMGKVKDLQSQLDEAKKAKAKAEESVKAAEIARDEAGARAETAEKRAEAAEQKVKDAEKKSGEVEKKLKEAEKKAADAEKKVKDAEKKTTEAEKKVKDAEKKAADAEKKGASSSGGQQKGGNKADNKATKAAADAGKAAKADAEQAKADLAKASADLEATQKELEATKEKLQSLEQELAASKKSAEEAEKARDEAISSTEEARKAVELAKEGEKSAKEEQESLLLVLGEIEAKRDEYKGRVKELGGEVSEDEDDDEEEDEDEESEGEGDETLD